MQATPQPWMRRQAPAAVNELCDLAIAWAESYYQKTTRDGTRRPTREHNAIRDALAALRAVAGEQDPTQLAAEDLCACQQWMIERGISRKVINRRINRIRRIIRWAAKPPRRWLPSSVPADMALVDPIKPGRTAAPELRDVPPVAWSLVSDTIAHGDLQLATMIELQWHTGMRPNEITGMWRSELHDAGAECQLPQGGGTIVVPEGLMLYLPGEHKTQHHSDDRPIWIGPDGQSVLRPWLERVPEQMENLWSLTKPNSYRQKIVRVNEKHKLAHWYPLQIRHSFATRIERIGGATGGKSAQLLLGHSDMQTTQIYVDPDMQAAMDMIRKHG